MQPNPYPNDPFERPTEVNPPVVPPQPGSPNISPYRENVVRPAPDVERAAAERERAYTFAYGIGKFIDYLRWVLLVLEVTLLLRFLFKLIGADPTNPFAAFLYNLSDIFLFMFKGIVTNFRFAANGTHVFEWTTLIGMVVYALIYWVLRLLLRTVISRPQEPVG